MAEKDNKPVTDAPIMAAPDPEAAKQFTEIEEGGKYVVGDRLVDANGKDLGPAPKKK